MSLENFLSNPWKESHPLYEDAFFHIRPAPEFATAEVVLASVYRACGFDGMSEKQVPIYGRELRKEAEMPKVHHQSGSKIDMETWRVVIQGVLESPKQPNQSSKRFLQMCPVVPDVALYSGSPRLAGNSWNPGQLVQRLISFGCDSFESSSSLWQKLFDALSVSKEDDVWGRWLQQEFEIRRRARPAWAITKLPKTRDLPPEDKVHLRFPAQQFVRDLDAVIQAKPCMTRRQWVSLLEALLRVASVSHVLWLCDVNRKLWEQIQKTLKGAPPLSASAVRETIINCDSNFLGYGNPAVPTIRDYISLYLVGRLGINATLWNLNLLGVVVKSLATSTDVAALLETIAEKRNELVSSGLLNVIADVQDENARTIACKKGIGSNLVEFARHVLGQRQTANDSLRGYDQGYILRKRSEHKSAPWVVSLGPVAVLALVHCCLRDAAGPRSIHRLSQHLGCYGIHVDRDDLTASDLGRKLRMLGLVLDSPDAESGMLLIPPFGSASNPQQQSQ